MLSLSRLVLLACFASAVLVGCTPSAEEASGPKADPQEWAWLTENQQLLNAQRDELRALVAQQATVTSEEEKAALAEQITAKETEVVEATEAFVSRLVTYINSLQILQDQPPTPEQLAAIRMKSAEDMETAREWIEKGGDYLRAIEIYNSQLKADPDNEDLKAALATAEVMRFMTPDRFAAVKKGMTQDEVRAALGQVHLRNVRVDEEKGVTSWLYRTEDGGGAGVFFKQDAKSDVLVVYDSKFDYVKPQVVESPDGAAESPATTE